jgi:hypothetical protein
MDFGIVILCPDRNLGGLKNSVGSIQHYYSEKEVICVVGQNTTPQDLKEFKLLCPTHKGDTTITSLINLGMKKNKHEWAFLIFAGSRMPPNVQRKFDYFCKNDSDVLFPVIDRKWSFAEGSFNGVLLNTKFFQQVGDFPCIASPSPDVNDFELAKALWAATAMINGAQFKGIVGLKII